MPSFIPAIIYFFGVAAQIFWVAAINVTWSVLLFALVTYMLPPLVGSATSGGGFIFPDIVLKFMTYLQIGRCIALIISTITLKIFKTFLAGILSSKSGFPTPINFPGK